MEAGLNLYSIKNRLKTEEDFLAVTKELKEAGYSYLQFSGSKLPFEAVKRVIDETNMPVYLTHNKMERIINETDLLMEEHSLINCKNIGQGMMPLDILTDEKKFKTAVENIDKAAEKMQKNGFMFFYHHHNYEFYKHNGKTCFDYIIENAPHIHFTIDTYWLQYGGVDVVDFLDKVKGRAECVHLKDYGTNIDMKPFYAPVGEGVMNFKKIINKLKQVGAKYFFVEQDNASELIDGLDQVKRSIKYIKENF